MFIEEASFSPHVRVCFIFSPPPLPGHLVSSAVSMAANFMEELPPSCSASAALRASQSWSNKKADPS